MCGICGWLNTAYQIDLSIIKRMNNIVRHRGPDDEGYAVIFKNGIQLFRGQDSRDNRLPLFFNDGVPEGGFMAFGHRRLSILDLSAKGHQPMCSADGQLCVTFNGEIYNYIELRQELVKKGYFFQSGSDTEVLIAAYREWGEECVEHFNGMWGFALWDVTRHLLFCSRDRLGAKPFYYYWDGENFLFASEIKQLCQNPYISRRMNDGLIATEIFWGIADFSKETWLQDVKALQGGDNLILGISTGEECKVQNFHVYRYWDVNTSGDKEEAAIAHAMKVHRDAVRIRTRSDVPIGVMLSGGLDSSTLVADVSEYYREIGRTPRDIQTFTSCYGDFKEGDESGFAHAVNVHCGTTENFIYPDELDTLSVWEKMIWHKEGMAGLNALGAFLLLREIGKTKLKVLLNGQGSDETMFGYERYYAWYLKDIYKKQGMASFLQAWNNAAKNSRLSHWQLLAFMGYFLCYPLRKKRVAQRMKPYASPYLMRSFWKNDEVRRFLDFPNMAMLQYNELRGTQLPHILHGDDRIYMAFSIESRVPFIDYRYVEEAVKIPEQLKIVDGYTKYPLRKYIEGHLPESVVWRRNKMGWPSPRERWIDRFDKKRIADILKNPYSEKLFNLSAIRNLWQCNPYHYALEQFLNVELFIRHFDVMVGA